MDTTDAGQIRMVHPPLKISPEPSAATLAIHAASTPEPPPTDSLSSHPPDQKMNVLRHYQIPDENRPIVSPHFIKNNQKRVATFASSSRTANADNN
jgi:hypothetical protein